MNQMGHGLPNMIGMSPGNLDQRVRQARVHHHGRNVHRAQGANELPSGYRDPGWYENPAGTLAELAEARELERDGINPAAPPKAERGGDA